MTEGERSQVRQSKGSALDAVRSQAAASPLHPHEPSIPPALDSDGRCLVCKLLVERDGLRATVANLDRANEALGEQVMELLHEFAPERILSPGKRTTIKRWQRVEAAARRVVQRWEEGWISAGRPVDDEDPGALAALKESLDV